MTSTLTRSVAPSEFFRATCTIEGTASDRRCVAPSIRSSHGWPRDFCAVEVDLALPVQVSPPMRIALDDINQSSSSSPSTFDGRGRTTALLHSKPGTRIAIETYRAHSSITLSAISHMLLRPRNDCTNSRAASDTIYQVSFTCSRGEHSSHDIAVPCLIVLDHAAPSLAYHQGQRQQTSGIDINRQYKSSVRTLVQLDSRYKDPKQSRDKGINEPQAVQGIK